MINKNLTLEEGIPHLMPQIQNGSFIMEDFITLDF